MNYGRNVGNSIIPLCLINIEPVRYLDSESGFMDKIPPFITCYLNLLSTAIASNLVLISINFIILSINVISFIDSQPLY